jgi:NAD dependent epimerase/dehydratase family enzyme
MPNISLKAIFGEMADATLLASSRIAPSRLLLSGYQFVAPDLREALLFECGLSHRA